MNIEKKKIYAKLKDKIFDQNLEKIKLHIESIGKKKNINKLENKSLIKNEKVKLQFVSTKIKRKIGNLENKSIINREKMKSRHVLTKK